MTKTTTFVWDPVSDCVISELDGTNDVQAVYTNEPQQYGGVLSQRRDGVSSTLHADALGTTRLLTDSTQTTTDTYLYDAWGNLVASSGATVNPFRWVGRYGYYMDESTRMVYVRARMYIPATAGWSSLDPAEFLDGLNRFRYCRNKSTQKVDPRGLWISRQGCINECEDDCASRFYPSPWNPWYSGCVNGCPMGCDNEDFTFCSYVNGFSPSYKESLHCICGTLMLVDQVNWSPPVTAVIGGLDCACSVITAIQESCRGGKKLGSAQTALALANCGLNIAGIYDLGRFWNNFVKAHDLGVDMFSEAALMAAGQKNFFQDCWGCRGLLLR